MKYPEFFDHIESIKLKDPLGEFLGAFDEGIIEITYLDLVKMAGHSCPTLAGAYLSTREGLKLLYPEEIPRRGEITASFGESCTSGVTGVIAQVVSNITGATSSWGFQGINGQFDRRELMHFEAPLGPSTIRFGRRDTKTTVDIAYTPAQIVQPKSLFQMLQGPHVTQETHARFASEWQRMVEEIFMRSDEVLNMSISSDPAVK